MNSEIEQQLVEAAFQNEGGREAFLSVMAQLPLNKDNFDAVWSCGMSNAARGWVMEGFTPQLLPILTTPDGWDAWSESFPFLDTALLGVSDDPRWFEALTFRWLSVDGRPEGGERRRSCNSKERSEFFATGWDTAIAHDNITRLEQMLNHPQWLKHLKTENINLAAWRSVGVWRTLARKCSLPLRIFWKCATVGTLNDREEKLDFLMHEAGSTPDFIIQQYVHTWVAPFPLRNATSFQKIAPQVLGRNLIQTLHLKIVERLFNIRLPDWANTTSLELAQTLKATPLFECKEFLKVITDSTQIHWNETTTETVDILIDRMDDVLRGQLLTALGGSPNLNAIPCVQRHRIETQIATDAHTRVKKI